MALQVGDNTIETDEFGFLLEPDDWNEEVAEALAKVQGVTMTDEHWKVMHFMREYFAEHGVAPAVRFTIKFIATELGKGREANPYLLKLFPYGYVNHSCKIAGMRKPRAWSSG